MPLPAPLALVRLQQGDLAPPVFVRGVPELVELDQNAFRSAGCSSRPPRNHARALWTEGKAPEAHARSIHIHAEIVAAARHAIGAELGGAGAAMIGIAKIHTGFTAR